MVEAPSFFRADARRRFAASPSARSSRVRSRQGHGRVNGGGYSFLLTAVDGQAAGGGGSDAFRLKVWNGAGVVYDNATSASDDLDRSPTQPIAAGNIVIHK